MKKLIIIATLMVFDMHLCNLSAQKYDVRNILELQNDLSARTQSRQDSNGNDCAILRVNAPSVKTMSFNNSVVGDVEVFPGEYVVYVSNGIKTLSYDINGEVGLIDFEKFGIVIEGKKCYRIILSNVSNHVEKPNGVKVSISANYDNAVVLLDGVPVGQTPIELDNVEPGIHVLSVPNTIGVTMKDQEVSISKDKENTILLSLHKENRHPVLIDMATPGGDTAGWYMVYGTNVKDNNGKKGIVDYEGNVLVPFEFDYIYPGIQNGYYVVTQNDKEGLYEPGKGLVVSCIYDAIVTRESYTHDHYMPVRLDHKWGVISPTGKLVVPIEYENYPHCYEGIIQVEKKDYGYGYFSYNGQPIIEPKYKVVNPFSNGYALFGKSDNSKGLVDINGNEKIIPSNYSFGTWGDIGAVYTCGLFPVFDNEIKKWGYMDRDLNLVIPAIYDENYRDAPNFSHGLAIPQLNGKDIVIDNKGRVVVDCDKLGYRKVDIISDEAEKDVLIEVKDNNGKNGVLNSEGKIVVPIEYKRVDISYDDDEVYISAVSEDKTDIYVNSKLTLSLPSEYQVFQIMNGFIQIRDNNSGSYGYINKDGDLLANCIFVDDESESSDDGSSEEDEDDNKIDILTYLIEDRPISEGLALLVIGDRCGFIDNTGKVVVPLHYTAVTPFENSVAYVRDLEGNWSKIYRKDI